MRSTRALNALLDGPISMEERACERILSVIFPKAQGETVRVVIDAVSGRGSEKPSTTCSIQDGIATIGIYGVITPQETEDDDYWGLISCERIRSDLRCAMEDPDVQEIMLAISSPGGSVLGLDQTAAMIREAKAQKPITAYSNGMACSAAYYLAAQANEFCVSRDSINGSIGCYSTIYDMSRMYKNYGIDVEVIRAGTMKGAGTPGTPITDAVRAERQRIVDTYYNQFIDAVAAGRNMPRDKALSLGDGRVYVGSETLSAGLCDSVDTMDAVSSRLVARAKGKAAQARLQIKGEQAMTEAEKKAAQDEAQAAERKRAMDITAAFPKNPAFAVRMINEGKSLLEAKAAYADELATENAAKDVEIAALKESQTSAKGKTGNATIPSGSGACKATEGGEGGATSKEQFAEKVDAQIAKGVQRAVAVQRVAAKHPELHKAMVAEANTKNVSALEEHESFKR